MDAEDAQEWVPLKVRRQQKLENIKGFCGKRRLTTEDEKVELGPLSRKSLFDQQFENVKLQSVSEVEEGSLRELITQDRPLVSALARAHGQDFESSLETTWKVPSWAEGMPDRDKKIRSRLMIDVLGEDIPPPLESFEDMRLPPPILKYLNGKGFNIPSPIQTQGLPIILSGRDMIGIARTGSGKTLAFTLPIVLFAYEEECRCPLGPEEGPFGLILCPSRELALQTYEFIQELSLALQDGNLRIKSQLVIGGMSLTEQRRDLQSGVHIIVATTGRLIYWLNQKVITLLYCKYLCLDEADRLIDVAFENDIRVILNYMTFQHQTVLFSATMPKTIQKFAVSALVRPVEVNVGRAGAASLNIVQEVEYVVPEAKIIYLLDCLQKTPPPVLIFCENKNDVDDIHEYLLLKGIQATAVHGGKGQMDRVASIKSFRNGKSEVLIATDVASKGLDFPDVQHVINFDMPREIENYVHRIGRTGRGVNTGIATTFINKYSSPTILADLKQILIESKQKVPPFLENFDGKIGECECCGGLGHTISECPKAGLLRKQQIGVVVRGRSEFRGGGGY